MRRSRCLELGTLALGAAAGLMQIACGPIEYLGQVSVRAAGAVAAARAAGGAEYAPYEMTAAEAYLEKAREEAAHSEYQAALDFGQDAEENANRARAIAFERRNVTPARAKQGGTRIPADGRPR